MIIKFLINYNVELLVSLYFRFLRYHDSSVTHSHVCMFTGTPPLHRKHHSLCLPDGCTPAQQDDVKEMSSTAMSPVKLVPMIPSNMSCIERKKCQQLNVRRLITIGHLAILQRHIVYGRELPLANGSSNIYWSSICATFFRTRFNH